MWGHHQHSQTKDSIQHSIEGLGMKSKIESIVCHIKKSTISCCCCQWAGGAVTQESRANCIPRNQPCLSTADSDITLSWPHRIKWKSHCAKPSIPLQNSSWIAVSISAARWTGSRVLISQVPPKNWLINAIWSYKCKQHPDGTLLKHKAHICANGSQQQYGIDNWDTFAPTVAWITVCLILCLSPSLLNLHGHQIIYTQAFLQADLNDPVFMWIPKGWELTDTVCNIIPNMAIKLKKNLYGTKATAHNWYLKLKASLEAHDFKVSAIDPCLFMQNNGLIVLYTDDCLCFSQDPNMLFEQLIAELHHDGFLLKDEGDFSDFLGIHIKWNPTAKQIVMTQTGLIDHSILIPMAQNVRKLGTTVLSFAKWVFLLRWHILTLLLCFINVLNGVMVYACFTKRQSNTLDNTC